MQKKIELDNCRTLDNDSINKIRDMILKVRKMMTCQSLVCLMNLT